MFLTTFVQVIVIGQYPTRAGFLHRFSLPGGWLYYPYRQFLLCTIATLSIAWEQPQRRKQITYYIIPRTVEIFWKMLKNRRLIKRDFKLQNPVLIGLAFGVIAFKYSEEQEARQKKSSTIRTERDQNCIQGLAARACGSLWGNHHTFRCLERERPVSQLDDRATEIIATSGIPLN